VQLPDEGIEELREDDVTLEVGCHNTVTCILIRSIAEIGAGAVGLTAIARDSTVPFQGGPDHVKEIVVHASHTVLDQIEYGPFQATSD